MGAVVWSGGEICRLGGIVSWNLTDLGRKNRWPDWFQPRKARSTRKGFADDAVWGQTRCSSIKTKRQQAAALQTLRACQRPVHPQQRVRNHRDQRRDPTGPHGDRHVVLGGFETSIHRAVIPLDVLRCTLHVERSQQDDQGDKALKTFNVQRSTYNVQLGRGFANLRPLPRPRPLESRL